MPISVSDMNCPEEAWGYGGAEKYFLQEWEVLLTLQFSPRAIGMGLNPRGCREVNRISN